MPLHDGPRDAMTAPADAVRNFAPVVRAYYCALVEAGFDPIQAMQLTVAWQTSIVTRRAELAPVPAARAT
jgi:hypothetical protein